MAVLLNASPARSWDVDGDPLRLSDWEQIACATLRGEAPMLPSVLDEASSASFLERLRYHGVTALLHERVAGDGRWPSALLTELREDALVYTMWELRHQRLISELLSRLASQNIHPILFKGTALAYATYDNPAARIRGDTDILIAERDRGAVDAALRDLGFGVDCGEGIEFICFQASYVWQGAEPASHAIDMHWGISNSYFLSRLFTYDELRAHADPLPKLSPDSLGANPVYALLIACMHRARHKQSAYNVDGVAYYGGDRLIWLYDIHLLAAGLTEHQWQDVVRLAREKTLGPVCREGLERALAYFGTTLPFGILNELAPRESAKHQVADYLDSSRLRQHWMDFCAVPGARERLRFLGELVLPPEEYMRSMWPDGKDRPLAQLYARRIFRRFTRRPNQDRSSA